MKATLSQSNAINFATPRVGTSSLLLDNQFNVQSLNPSKLHQYVYQKRDKSAIYHLKHELTERASAEIEEPVVEMPIIKQLKVKFNKPKSLVFTCVEDNEGFIK